MKSLYQNIKSFWRYADSRSRIAILIILLFIITGSLSGLLVGPKPLLWKDATGVHSCFSSTTTFMYKNAEWKIGPLMPYSPSYIDTNASGAQAPFSSAEDSFWLEHWLGTDQLGRDVLSSMIFGASTALKVGLLAAFLALLIAIILGAAAGYYGDHGLKISRIELLLLVILTLIWGYNLCFLVVSNLVLWCIFIALWLVIRYIAKGNRNIKVPVDSLVMRMIEVMNVLPGLLVILVLLSIFQMEGVMSLSFAIALLMWPKLTQFMRAEMLDTKTKTYISAAKASGTKDMVVIWRHALPNALPPVLIAAAFSISSSILLESTISFLGLGFNGSAQTWGSLLAEARSNFSAWWLVVFPGLAIFLVVMAFNILAERLSDYWRKT